MSRDPSTRAKVAIKRQEREIATRSDPLRTSRQGSRRRSLSSASRAGSLTVRHPRNRESRRSRRRAPLRTQRCDPRHSRQRIRLPLPSSTSPPLCAAVALLLRPNSLANSSDAHHCVTIGRARISLTSLIAEHWPRRRRPIRASGDVRRRSFRDWATPSHSATFAAVFHTGFASERQTSRHGA